MHGHAKKAHLRDYMIAAFLLALLFWAYLMYHSISPPVFSSVTINGATTAVEIAHSPEAHTKGLSGRPSLSEGEGLLFLFDHPDRYGFWMPEMHFAIDIIWIGPDRRIVDLALQVAPDSYPKIFTPSLPAQYVLEVPAGSAERYGWRVGNRVTFNGTH